jgi:hypothetical protein
MLSHTRTNGLDPFLRDIWMDIMTASLIFNRLAEAGTLDITTYHEITMSLAYRLLRFRTLGDAKLLLDEQSAHHMSLVVFMMTVFMQHTHSRILKLHLAVECLDAIFAFVIKEDDDDFFVLWFAIIADMWISGEQDEQWLLQIVRSRSRKLGLLSWETAQKSLKRYPWIDRIHNSPGETVWNAAQELY